MRKRQYFNFRTGAQSARLTFEEARRLVHDTFVRLEDDYFQEWFGYHCVDAGRVPGKAGDITSYVYKETRIDGVQRIRTALAQCPNEVTLFTLIEFLDEHVSRGIESGGYYHPFNDCGWHYREFSTKEEAQPDWRREIAPILTDYGDGYEFSDAGEIQLTGASGLRDIMNASVPATATTDDRQKIESAIRRFRRARATRKEHVDAVRDLADILERLRPEVKKHLLTEDERLLFNLANNFGIRHYNEKQKKNFDPAALAWMFYVYLATIHLVLRLVDRGGSKQQQNAAKP